MVAVCWAALRGLGDGYNVFCLTMSSGVGRRASGAGQTIKKDSQVQLAMFVTIPLLWFSAAGSAVFWVIGASLVIVMGHSMMLPIPSESLSDTILEGIV